MPSRRAALRLAGSVISVGIAGCAGNLDNEKSPTQSTTQSPSPTESPSPTRSPTESPTSTPLPDVTLDDFAFDVTIVKQVTSQHPARIETTLTNQAGSAITIDDGVTPPWASFTNQVRDDNEWLLLVPDMDESRYDVDALSNLDALPSTPTSDACWHVSENVYNLLRQRFTTIAAGESVTQPFDVYDFQGDKEDDTCLASGDYQFKDEPGLGRGTQTPTSSTNSFSEITLRFTLTIQDDNTISVAVAEPVIG